MATSARPPVSAGTRVPDFFIVGHEKCGTTALFNILRQHPQIFMPDLKEPRFFFRDRPQSDSTKEWIGAGADLRPGTLDAYLSLFADAGTEQRAGEASPQYIRSPDAARLIAQVQPGARIIAVLREPTSLVQNFHLNNLLTLVEDERDLRKAIALEGQRREGLHIPPGSRAPDRLFYCDHVRYGEQLQRLQSHFPAEQIMVILYDDFRRDNDGTARRVLRFLDIDDTHAFELPHTSRDRKAVRSPRLHRAVLALQRARRRPAQAGRLSRTVEALTPGVLRNDAVENLVRRLVFSVPRPPDEELLLELRGRFKPEVVALSEYLGRDLVREWGYERID
jgi:hypothetical protein